MVCFALEARLTSSVSADWLLSATRADTFDAVMLECITVQVYKLE